MRLLALTLLSTLAFAEPLAEADRDRILTELQTSRKQLIDSLAGLSQAQWNYKAGPDRWSIGETAEHIVNAEPFLRGLSTQMMSAPAQPAKAEKRKAMNSKIDEGLLAGLHDRSKKVSAPGEIVPKGVYRSPADALAAFQMQRDQTVAYVRATNADLRGHFFEPFPGTEMDGVQLFLMIAGHNERHVLQIEEVKQSPGYPKQ